MSKKKQTVIQVEINGEKGQKEIFSKLGKINGISSMSVDETKKTVTVTGTSGPVPIFKALKKIKKKPEILTVGPAKPKCPHCQYLQGVCTCGIGTTTNYSNYPYFPQPTFYDSYNYQPPSSYYQPPPLNYCPINVRRCELIEYYPPDYDTGNCSIV